MKKKRLLLILLILIPYTYSMECVTYRDCAVMDCIGSVRFCEEGNCIYSGCLPLEESYEAGNDETGIDIILGLTGKAILLAIFVLAVAIFFPMLHLHRKTKIFIAVLFGILTIVFGLYIFGGEDIINIILGKQSSMWDSDSADRQVIDFINKEKLDVTERVLKSPKIIGGKEYRLQDTIHENNLIILTFGHNSSLKDIIPAGGSSQKRSIEGNEITLNRYPFYQTMSWEKEEFTFILTGREEDIMEISRELLRNRTESLEYASGSDMMNQPINEPPVILINKPYTGASVSENLVSFEVYDTDSRINESSIDVLEQDGFSIFDCHMTNNHYNCSFPAEMHQGENELTVEASDIYGRKTTEEIHFVYDNLPWKLLPIYPEDGSYVNVPTIHFQLEDKGSGIDIRSFNLTGFELSLSSCRMDADTYDCDFPDVQMNEGENELLVEGYDIAGNYKNERIVFYYDITRPVIKLTDNGFIVEDNLKLRKDSLMLDNNRYSLDTCEIIGEAYHCQHDSWIRSISVLDEAGNRFHSENKLQR